jgi:hypothetical protein
MIFGKKNIKKEILDALDKKDFEKIKKLSIKTFEKEPDNEDLLAFICGVIFENQIYDLNDLFFKFRDKFPFSLHPVRVFISELLTHVKKYDDATTESRFYLRTALENKQLESPHNEIIKSFVGRAFYLTTCAYTEMGARDYAKNVINYANTILSDKWHNEHWNKVYADEIKALDKELENEENIVINNKWNDFFKTGANANELYDLCTEKDFKDLARRVDLIESNFRFNTEFEVGISEIFMLIYEGEEEGYLLR